MQLWLVLIYSLFLLPLAAQTGTQRYKVIAWNDLGMHCMDGKDYSLYSILPPFNTFHAHVVDRNGKLVKSGSGVRLSYEAAADPTGSINRTTIGKTNFWSFVQPLFGTALAPDMGLAGFAMPGAANQPRAMRFDGPFNWFTAEGVPIGPYDDAGNKNYYPLMRVVARDAAGRELARTEIVLPVSDELDCRACHASGLTSTARPAAGWAFLNDPEKDFKTNVLKLHDERRGTSLLASAASGKPALCAGCHASNALPGTGKAGISPLTQAVHRRHANVVDPTNNLVLDSASNRSACYRCHPGSETKCLRGAMGNALNADGSMQMQCQSCHGNMTAVGASTRQGWLQQPSCQNCHTGTALQNNGQIRYTSAFTSGTVLRQAVNRTFATNANTPATGLDLYRFSKGHGGLQCESCHGSTHAEYPSSHANDNLQSIRLQGYAGTLTECTACHSQVPETVTGGPHGMHPVGQYWVNKHEDPAEKNVAQCRTCHGADYRGTVLSKASTNRTFQTEWGTRSFAKGKAIGCYDCHRGPNP